MWTQPGFEARSKPLSLHRRIEGRLGWLPMLLVLTTASGCFQSDYSDYKTFGDADLVKTAPEASGQSEDQAESQVATSSKEPSQTERASVSGDKPQAADSQSATATVADAGASESLDSADGKMTPVRPETKANSLRSDLIVAPEAGVESRTASAPVSALKAANSSNVDQRGAEVMPADQSGNSSETPVLREVKLLIPEKQFSAEGKDQALRVSYDDLDLLKVLNMEPVTDQCVELMPDWLKQLNGQKVRIRGFMYPTFEATGITEFVLARDNQICCFGRNPKVYDLIGVKMAAGKTTHYIPNRPFDVTGTFVIEKASAEGEIFGLYWIRDAVINER
ncbi:hypothetical protein Spb1_14290 [Planctopirus ephydatiae]|uniref:DUF3299 domain-containing protein n=1 Tax=Planctopirus ephydatiae TaxID=2528019 RepID=A0A518GLI9_9PLAN|nr:hypothetical protein Spb1_14290 [Planctopirus ephydatiae]